jgi:hypothetical protein
LRQRVGAGVGVIVNLRANASFQISASGIGDAVARRCVSGGWLGLGQRAGCEKRKQQEEGNRFCVVHERILPATRPLHWRIYDSFGTVTNGSCIGAMSDRLRLLADELLADELLAHEFWLTNSS